MPCLIHVGQLLHEGPYQFAGHSGSIVRIGGDVGFDAMRGEAFARRRTATTSATMPHSEIMQVQRPANRIGREKSELLDGSNQPLCEATDSSFRAAHAKSSRDE
jgi:hypothetical protein